MQQCIPSEWNLCTCVCEFVPHIQIFKLKFKQVYLSFKYLWLFFTLCRPLFFFSSEVCVQCTHASSSVWMRVNRAIARPRTPSTWNIAFEIKKKTKYVKTNALAFKQIISQNERTRGVAYKVPIVNQCNCYLRCFSAIPLHKLMLTSRDFLMEFQLKLSNGFFTNRVFYLRIIFHPWLNERLLCFVRTWGSFNTAYICSSWKFPL